MRGKNGKFIKKEPENIIADVVEMNDQENWIFSLVTIIVKTLFLMIARLLYHSFLFLILALIIRKIGIWEFVKESINFTMEIISIVKDIGIMGSKPNNSTNTNGEAVKSGYFS
jgi:hypothetical protein